MINDAPSDLFFVITPYITNTTSQNMIAGIKLCENTNFVWAE